MSYTWTGVDDFYYGKWYVFTGMEIEHLEGLRKDGPHFSQKELLEIFPEAKDILKEQLKTLKPLLEEKNNEIRTAVVKKEEAGRSEVWFFEMCLENRQQEYKKLEKKIRRIEFILNPPVKNNHYIGKDTITQDDIDRAKEVPISDFITVNEHRFAKCPFHEENSGSFKYYKEQNRYYCFGCTAGGDVIDFVSRQNNCGFLEAVRMLLRK